MKFIGFTSDPTELHASLNVLISQGYLKVSMGRKLLSFLREDNHPMKLILSHNLLYFLSQAPGVTESGVDLGVLAKSLKTIKALK